jgi:glycosyltransferase involved in cell wall biosynthesis
VTGQSPLKILYVLNASGGGATQGVLELLRVLPREAYRAFLVVPDQPSGWQQQVFSRLSDGFYRVPMAWWNLKVDLPFHWRILVWLRDMLKTLGHLFPVWQLCRIIREQQIDIVYTNTVMILDGALAAWLCGVPHIWHIKEWIGSAARVKFALPDALLVRLIAGFSARVIVMTHFIGEIFTRSGAADKLQVLYDGVALSDFQSGETGEALRTKLGIAHDQFVVGMSASLSATWKQHDVFIEMAGLLANRLTGIAFVAFGPEPRPYANSIYNRPWHYYRTLRQQVSALGLQDRFYWAGFCGDIPAMMASLDVLVHPCETEPFGRVVIEAMAASRPVVGPRRGGVLESVVQGETGLLVAPGSPQAFADAVQTLYEDKQYRMLLSAQACARAAQEFSIQKHLAQICEIYQSVSSITKVGRA